ncbi:MAG: YdcF family protein [Candidatus Harrisonbacteria bacterium]|nr:YdcF family protein [Candidatus Harrisonbacteria bacterium]
MENVLICGYGCHLTKDLKNFLQFVVQHLASAGSSVGLVITSGGYTNQKTAPGVCEAMLMKNYLHRLGVQQPIICEDEAVTTHDNLRFTAELLQKLSQNSFPLKIFCDSIRKFKVRFLAKRIFSNRITVSGYNFDRPTKEKIRQYCIATPLEILAFYVPCLERKMKMRRFALNQSR